MKRARRGVLLHIILITFCLFVFSFHIKLLFVLDLNSQCSYAIYFEHTHARAQNASIFYQRYPAITTDTENKWNVLLPSRENITNCSQRNTMQTGNSSQSQKSVNVIAMMQIGKLKRISTTLPIFIQCAENLRVFNISLVGRVLTRC